MTGGEIIRAVTENMERVLTGLGVRFEARAAGEAEAALQGAPPAGVVEYRGENFERSYGLRPTYVEVLFEVKVFLRGHRRELVGSLQRWIHDIREALTVNNLNSGALAADKPVSLVDVDEGRVAVRGELATVSASVRLRYREST